MRVPTIQGVIDRRLLVNFRIDAGVLSTLLPSPFRPQLVKGFGIAGICLIRLKHIRPRFLPAFIGISSENAAHRIAVEWDCEHGIQTGVYIPRRDTSSLLNTAAGGRLFPGVHHRARFDVSEHNHRFHVALNARDGSTRAVVDGTVASEFPSASVFGSLAAASDFFKQGALGYSPSGTGVAFDGLELRSSDWRVEPLDVERVESSYFDDPRVFPEDSVAFDCALLMRGIHHEWHSRESLGCEPRHARC